MGGQFLCLGRTIVVAARGSWCAVSLPLPCPYTARSCPPRTSEVRGGGTGGVRGGGGGLRGGDFVPTIPCLSQGRGALVNDASTKARGAIEALPVTQSLRLPRGCPSPSHSGTGAAGGIVPRGPGVWCAVIGGTRRKTTPVPGGDARREPELNAAELRPRGWGRRLERCPTQCPRVRPAAPAPVPATSAARCTVTTDTSGDLWRDGPEHPKLVGQSVGQRCFACPPTVPLPAAAGVNPRAPRAPQHHDTRAKPPPPPPPLKSASVRPPVARGAATRRPLRTTRECQGKPMPMPSTRDHQSAHEPYVATSPQSSRSVNTLRGPRACGRDTCTPLVPLFHEFAPEWGSRAAKIKPRSKRSRKLCTL